MMNQSFVSMVVSLTTNSFMLKSYNGMAQYTRRRKRTIILNDMFDKHDDIEFLHVPLV
jgi:hypothetical protein